MFTGFFSLPEHLTDKKFYKSLIINYYKHLFHRPFKKFMM